MRSLLELLSIISIIVFFGGLCWAAMAAISVTPEYGDGSIDKARTTKPLIVAGISIVIFIVASQIKKRLLSED